MRHCSVVWYAPSDGDLAKACALHCPKCNKIYEYSDKNLLAYKNEVRVESLSPKEFYEYSCPNCGTELIPIFKMLLGLADEEP